MKYFFLFLLFPFVGYAQTGNSDNVSGVEASQDTIAIRQIDGSTIHVIGFGNIRVSYTETIDGYTLMLNPVGLYEYAVQTKDGNLTYGGVPAHDPKDRKGKEKRYLKKKATMHLRYQNPALENILKGKK